MLIYRVDSLSSLFSYELDITLRLYLHIFSQTEPPDGQTDMGPPHVLQLKVEESRCVSFSWILINLPAYSLHSSFMCKVSSWEAADIDLKVFGLSGKGIEPCCTAFIADDLASKPGSSACIADALQCCTCEDSKALPVVPHYRFNPLYCAHPRCSPMHQRLREEK